MKTVILLLPFCVIAAMSDSSRIGDASSSTNCDKKAPHLDGDWVLHLATWNGDRMPLSKNSTAVLVFDNNRFKHQFDDHKENWEEGTYSTDCDKSPKWLDLNYKKGEVIATRRCIFSIERNELWIAYNMPYLPGSPEQEMIEAKKMFALRPKSFEPDPDGSTAVLVFKRRAHKGGRG